MVLQAVVERSGQHHGGGDDDNGGGTGVWARDDGDSLTTLDRRRREHWDDVGIGKPPGHSGRPVGGRGGGAMASTVGKKVAKTAAVALHSDEVA